MSSTGAFYVRVARSERVRAAREGLPIYAEEQRVMEAVHSSDTLLLCGETGSGKTTQVPQFLYEAGYGHRSAPRRSGMVGVTQPRRVAAVAMAQRVAHELGVKLGAEVAYQARLVHAPAPPRLFALHHPSYATLLRVPGALRLARLSLDAHQVHDRRRTPARDRI